MKYYNKALAVRLEALERYKTVEDTDQDVASIYTNLSKIYLSSYYSLLIYTLKSMRMKKL